MNWYYLLAIPVYKLAVNAINLYQLNHLEKQYYRWLVSQTDFAPLAEKRQLLKKLMKTANIDDAFISRTQPIGFGRIVSGHYNVFEQFPSNEVDIVQITMYKISEARGVFKSNCWETFNPLYWIQFFVFLPKRILEYLGVAPDWIITRLCQVIWGILLATISVLKLIYPDFFQPLLSKLLHSIIQLL